MSPLFMRSAAAESRARRMVPPLDKSLSANFSADSIPSSMSSVSVGIPPAPCGIFSAAATVSNCPPELPGSGAWLSIRASTADLQWPFPSFMKASPAASATDSWMDSAIFATLPPAPKRKAGRKRTDAADRTMQADPSAISLFLDSYLATDVRYL